MAGTAHIVHSAHKIESTKTGGFRVTVVNPEYRITRRVRKAMVRCAKSAGMNISFDEPQVGGRVVYLTEASDNRMHSPLSERVDRFARHFAPGGSRREDTPEAAVVLLGAFNN